MQNKNQNKYERYGYKNREGYMKHLSIKFEVEEDVVWRIAKKCGQENDFKDLPVVLKVFKTM